MLVFVAVCVIINGKYESLLVQEMPPETMNNLFSLNLANITTFSFTALPISWKTLHRHNLVPFFLWDLPVSTASINARRREPDILWQEGGISVCASRQWLEWCTLQSEVQTYQITTVNVLLHAKNPPPLRFMDRFAWERLVYLNYNTYM